MSLEVNRQAEMEVIAYTLFNGRLPDIQPELFGDSECRRVYVKLAELARKGLAITDEAALKAVEERDKSLVINLMGTQIPEVRLATSIKSIKEKHHIRYINRIGNRLVDQVSMGDHPEKVLQELQEELGQIIQLSTNRNITKEVRDLVDATTSGYISTTDCHNWLQLTTRKEKKAVNMALSRLAEEGRLEKNGRLGHYRIIHETIDYIDWESASDNEMEFTWPLNIRSLFMLSPKNQVVIAGDTNSGKTAIGMNIAAMNAHVYSDRIWYFSSEMGEIELKRRIRMFEQLEAPYNVPREVWRNVKFIDRVENFHDVIRPNDINIIDYLEIHDDFWKVGKLCADIHDRLDKGIAVIFIQKKQGASYGFGGDKSLQKARLGINLVNDDGINRATIVKCKNMREGVTHAYGLEKEYYIIKGALIKDKGNWTFPTQAELEARKKRAMKQGGY